jgi:hypothetical protein
MRVKARKRRRKGKGRLLCRLTFQQSLVQAAVLGRRNEAGSSRCSRAAPRVSPSQSSSSSRSSHVR